MRCIYYIESMHIKATHNNNNGIEKSEWKFHRMWWEVEKSIDFVKALNIITWHEIENAHFSSQFDCCECVDEQRWSMYSVTSSMSNTQKTYTWKAFCWKWKIIWMWLMCSNILKHCRVQIHIQCSLFFPTFDTTLKMSCRYCFFFAYFYLTCSSTVWFDLWNEKEENEVVWKIQIFNRYKCICHCWMDLR